MKRRILVVEDNAANLELLVDWLESENFQVQTATTLDEAFAAFKGEPPETVLLDVQLGAQDGLDAGDMDSPRAQRFAPSPSLPSLRTPCLLITSA